MFARNRSFPLLFAAAVAASITACARRGPLPVPAEVACRRAVGIDQRSAPHQLTWIAPDRGAAGLDEWCAAVGPAVVLGLPGGIAGSVDSLAVLTWNSHLGAGDLAALVRDLRSGRVAGGRPIEHFVILVQEAYRSGTLVPPPAAWSGRSAPGLHPGPRRGERVDIVAAARAVGLGVFYAPSMRNGAGNAGRDPEDRGNAILSSVPLDQLAAIELPLERQRRVALAARVGLRSSGGTAWEVQVVNVHLENRSGFIPTGPATSAARRRQGEALAAALHQSIPTVMAGDFNTWALGPAEPVMELLVDGHEFTHLAIPHWQPTFAQFWGAYERQLDHVLVRLPPSWSANVRRLDHAYGSDHFPLLAWVAPRGPSSTSLSQTAP